MHKCIHKGSTDHRAKGTTRVQGSTLQLTITWCPYNWAKGFPGKSFIKEWLGLNKMEVKTQERQILNFNTYLLEAQMQNNNSDNNVRGINKEK